MRPRPGLILLLWLPGLVLFSQPRYNHYFIGTSAHYGFIIPHTPAIEPASHTNPAGIEAVFGRLSTSYESWKVFRRYNISGIMAGYFNFRNPQVTGSAYTLTTFTEPLLAIRDRWIFSVRAGAGLSYQTKLYDYQTDSLNKFFSTRISFPLYLSARIKYRIAPNTFIAMAGNYNHISNGAMKVPNMGMNFPTFSLGMEQYFGKFPEFGEGYVPSGSNRMSGRYIVLQFLGAYKSVWGESSGAYGISARHVWQLRTYYALNAGAELISDRGLKKMTEIENRDVDYRRFAVTGGQDFILGKIIFSQHLGIYLYSPYKAKDPVYQKYELTYSIFPELLAGVFVKAHTSDAELFGITFNYRIRLGAGASQTSPR